MAGFQIDLWIPALDDSDKVFVIASHASAPPLERVLIEILDEPEKPFRIVTGARQAGVLGRVIQAGIAHGDPVSGVLGLTVERRRGAYCRLGIEQDKEAVSIELDPGDLVMIAGALFAIEAEARP